ncbi:hypothetical protein SAY86_013733 [Trapa natans]|uniref:AT-hook motif nuclear-localized protein n=1 Tax=Trapa natans TaxID=22666 RepID=A0AAN7KM70_TRANT|nr:hypothetical protein SAY86_013733 [Trapa natans]
MDQQLPDDNHTPSNLHNDHHPVTASSKDALLPLSSTAAATDTVCPHSATPATVSAQNVSRGRPRKYGTLDQALAAKKGYAMPRKEKKKQKQGQRELEGQGFTPHIIEVAAGKDVVQRIMLFVQQSKRGICVISATGSLSSASLRHRDTSGGTATYEGYFKIVTLTGSYLPNDLGVRTGGLSICLSDSSGHVVGGSVAGPLMAAGQVQVILASFSVHSKDTSTSNPSGNLPPPTGGAEGLGCGFGGGRSQFF